MNIPQMPFKSLLEKVNTPVDHTEDCPAFNSAFLDCNCGFLDRYGAQVAAGEEILERMKNCGGVVLEALEHYADEEGTDTAIGAPVNPRAIKALNSLNGKASS